MSAESATSALYITSNTAISLHTKLLTDDDIAKSAETKVEQPMTMIPHPLLFVRELPLFKGWKPDRTSSDTMWQNGERFVATYRSRLADREHSKHDDLVRDTSNMENASWYHENRHDRLAAELSSV
ncbi:kinase isozyme 4, mitochondrial precursor [Pseudozyma hubeiensis SY62]|uniref:Kinase isozyme 4, mitochondrial n=1 Tax=Pseudozyma hubeiensis (strain SY62) TaxID=1305764 RepID=R9PKG3_PSEHS|nr:kinase isozyme 4, mitochondrial precursor [Pseudozyma hubeiensis SY62]GAC98620.1 kinase isozyme 4, mitochondrial precursor [Pseudozyma hubeiensis SY62]